MSDLPFYVYVVVTTNGNMPCIQLRRSTTNLDIIKTLIIAAMHDRPVVMQPMFKNKLNSISSLIEKGVLRHENGQYFFNI